MPAPWRAPPTPDPPLIRPPETAQIRPAPPAVFAVRDPEKAFMGSMAGPSRHGSTAIPAPLQSPTHITVGAESALMPEPYDAHLMVILLHLSSTSPLVSLLFAFYALLALLLLILLSPLSLVTRRPSLAESASAYLSPVLRTQLRLVYSDATRPGAVAPLGPLVAAAVLGPVYAFAIMLAAWTVGVFWGFAAIVGEPNQKGGREEVGRGAVRSVRAWWEGFLVWGLEGRDEWG